MDLHGIIKHIEDWLESNEGKVNSMPLKIQKITYEYLEICIDAKVLQLTIPPNFYASCSADGIISNPNCAFVGMLAKDKLEESNNVDICPELMTALNEKLDRLSSRGFYSFSSILDSVIDTFQKYKYCSDCDDEIDEEEDAWINDSEGYFGFFGSNGTFSAHSQGRAKNGYLNQLIEDANKKCDGARSVAMPARTEVPGNENIKDDILRWCKVYSLSHSDWAVGFEIQLSGILSEYYRHRHGHVFEALGFSFATPLLIEVMFEPVGSTSKNTSLEDQWESLCGAFRGLSAMHGHIERKFLNGDDNPTVQDDPDEHIAKVIDVSMPNPVHMYGLRTLLPRIARDFFSQRGRDTDNDNNVLLACEDNIFVRFLLFIRSRLASLLNRCIVCNKELPFSVSKLCSCANELCLFGFEVLGLGAQVLQQVIQMPPELIDLEISLALAAAGGLRDVFEPFPPFLLEEREIRQRSLLNNGDNANPKPNSQTQSNSWEQSQNKNKNMDVLKSIIKSFPPVSEMRLCADEANLRANLAKLWLCTPEGKSAEKSGDRYFGKEVWKFPYNVLRFILCTNRLSLVYLSENDDKVLKVDNSRSQFYQFAVVQDSPEREAVYIESYRNNQDVSRFGFHGSRRENWYSILRNGLRCLSNTKLMSAGNSLGEGIYLANNFDYSANYTADSTGSPDHWMNGMYMNRFCVVSICEVISSPAIKGSSGIFVVPKEHEGRVAVRYLFVYAAHDRISGAAISDGHILCYGGDRVNLHQHYESIRQKYASGSFSQ